MARRYLFHPKNKVEHTLKRSRQAPDEVMRREMVVSNKDLSKAKQMLRLQGFSILGTSEPNGSTRKIWFIPSGGF